MKSPLRSILCGTTMTLLSVAPLLGQHPQVRQGFWIGFGFGWGSLGASCSGCGSISREGGADGHLRLGGTLSPHVLLGGDIVGWTKSDSGTTTTAGNVTFSAYYYPMVESGLFVTGGFGGSTYELSNSGNHASASGFGISLGVGYDIRVARMFSITPIGHFIWGAPGDLQYNGNTIRPGLKTNLFDIGLNATFH